MRFYTTDPTIAAMLATMGHTLHTIDRTSDAAVAVAAVGGAIFCRVPTRWKPALDRASGDKRLAAIILAVDAADIVIGDEGSDLGKPSFRVDDLAGVLAYVAQ